MLYITGDTHIPIDIQKLSCRAFPMQKSLTPDDYVIICGDFGGVWDNGGEERYWRKWLDGKNFTTLFADGNHENFDLLKEFPLFSINGARAHKIGEKIYHIMRGEVFEDSEERIFFFGGAASHDREVRKMGKNWWPDEMPSDKEYDTARKNLEKCNWQVDYVITHAAPTSIQREIAPDYEQNALTEFLEEIKCKLKYKKWFFGHYHMDKVMDKHIAVFNDIIKVGADAHIRPTNRTPPKGSM